jgi:hydroxypyruvate reductase
MCPEDLGARVAELLSEEGFASSTEVIEHGSVEALANHMVETSRTLEPGCARVITCEPVIRLSANAGRGGRAGWVALRVLLNPAFAQDAAVLCGASDGMDGTSGSGGACVSRDSMVGRERAELERALMTYDDAKVHADLGTRIESTHTGINLCDVYVCARGR